MDPRKTNARRGYADREQKRKLARQQAASEWQPVITPKEGKMNTFWRSIIIVGLVCLTVLCIGGMAVGYFATRPTETPPVVVETEAPPVVVETEAPPVVVETEAPIVNEPVVAAPVQVCPDTTEQAKQLFGVDVQRIGTEACGWVWRGKPESHSAVCPQGYICTWDVVDDVTVVHLGINQTANIFAGTWRLINAYPVGDTVYDTCALYAKEKDFGLKEVPSFEVRFQSVPGVGPTSCP
jgi:hypothetical protein